MTSLFSKSTPQVQPVPVAPTDDGKAEQQRAAAATAAQAYGLSQGRRSTIAAGGSIAAEEQRSRGLLAKERRNAASAELLG